MYQIGTFSILDILATCYTSHNFFSLSDNKINSSLLKSWPCTEPISKKACLCQSYSYGAVALYQNVVSHFWGICKIYYIFRWSGLCILSGKYYWKCCLDQSRNSYWSFKPKFDTIHSILTKLGPIMSWDKLKMSPRHNHIFASFGNKIHSTESKIFPNLTYGSKLLNK